MYKINEFIDIETSKDNLEAYILLSRERFFKDQINLEIILNNIKSYIKFGLDENIITSLLNNPIFDSRIKIATGFKPQNGSDGQIKYNFSINNTLTPKLLEDGTVDYKNLNSFNKVSVGEVVAEVLLPTNGVNGKDVFGNEVLSSPGKPFNVKIGKNVHISADGTQIISDSGGLVRLIDEKIVVENIYKVDSIGVSTGNIDFEGSVVVKNDVLSGFNLKATGLIDIRGKVEGGSVYSESDILVKQGIQGYGKYKVETKGALNTKFIENSIITAEGNITAEAIMHSNVESGGSIICIGKKGLMVGGVIKAKNEVQARTIGSHMATATVIEVGTDPKYKDKYIEDQNKLKEFEYKYNSILSNLQIFESLKNANKLDEAKLKIYDNLILAKNTLEIEINKINKEMKSAEEQLKNLANGKVRVTEKIYPGVKIVIGNAFMFVRDELQNCTLYKDGADIRVGPY